MKHLQERRVGWSRRSQTCKASSSVRSLLSSRANGNIAQETLHSGTHQEPYGQRLTWNANVSYQMQGLHNCHVSPVSCQLHCCQKDIGWPFPWSLLYSFSMTLVPVLSRTITEIANKKTVPCRHVSIILYVYYLRVLLIHNIATTFTYP